MAMDRVILPNESEALARIRTGPKTVGPSPHLPRLVPKRGVDARAESGARRRDCGA